MAAITWTGLVILSLAGQVGKSGDRWFLPAFAGSLAVSVLAMVVTHNAGKRGSRLVALAATAAVIATTVWAGGMASIRASDACLARDSFATPYKLDIGLDPWHGALSCKFVAENGEKMRILVPLHELLSKTAPD